jgi:hypothetical protein
MLNSRTTQMDTIEWHFFTSTKDHIAPDVRLLEELNRVNMPFTLWIS